MKLEPPGPEAAPPAFNHQPPALSTAQFVCPTLVGRQTELAELRACLEAGGGVVLISGEAGVGKSRLLSELLAAPEALEWAHVRAACLEPDQAEPYALVGSLAEAAGGAVANLPIGGAPEAERQVRRVQQALRETLENAARDGPVILAAEDLHWSDEPSLSVLLGLAQRPGRQLLVLTYRPAPLSPALAGFLAELGRQRLGREIVLRPLGRAEVARVAQQILDPDQPVPGALLDEVMAATEGNPFLVEELLRSVIESGALERTGTGWRRRAGVALHVPGSLRQAIEARLLRLPSQVARVAEVAAVLGQAVDMALLGRLAGDPEESLLAALRALVEAQVLAARPGGSLAFRHALTREAVLERLFEPEQRALHRRAAEALANDHRVPPAVLAYHWSRAGEIARAAPHALQAAERAVSVHAHREAIGHYELALDGGAGPRLALLVALADEHAAVGETEAALVRYQEARALLSANGEATRVAELDLRIGMVYASENERRRTEARPHLASALATLPVDHPERWRAGLHLAIQLAAMGDYTAAEATLGQTLEAAEHAGPLARIRVLYEVGGLRARRGDWTALEAAGASVLREAAEETDEQLALRYSAHAALGSVAYYRGAFDLSLQHFEACLRNAERRGMLGDQALARWNLATNALYNLGRWQEARAGLAELQALGVPGLGEGARMFELWLDGRWEHAAEMWLRAWSEHLEPTGDLEVLTAHGRRVADILLSLGRAHEALALLAKVLARIRAVEARSFELQLVPREAEALARLGDPRALEVCEAGLSLARPLGGRPAEGLLLRARALAHRMASHWAEAFADFDAAVALLSDLPMPYEAARTLREAGLARLARGRKGDREHGAEHLRQARNLFADLGAARDEAAVSGILSAAGLAQRAERGPGPLSAREREVAELVAQGLSNREIADRLFITEKTAAYHVGAILNKLGFTSRAQIAAYMALESQQ